MPVWEVRLAGALVALAALAVLTVAAWLRPRPGVGTHTQLGLTPCGFLLSTGIPCPTCGMTTSFSLMVRGELRAAVRAQPAGAVLFVLTVMAAVGGVMTVWMGRAPRIRLDGLASGPGLAVLGLLFFGAWAWKITAHLLSQRPGS